MKIDPAKSYLRAGATYGKHYQDYLAASAWFFLVSILPIVICLLTPLTLILTLPLFYAAVFFALELYVMAKKDNLKVGFNGVKTYYFRYFSPFFKRIYRVWVGCGKAVGFAAAISFIIGLTYGLIANYLNPEFAQAMNELYSSYLLMDMQIFLALTRENVHVLSLLRVVQFVAVSVFTLVFAAHLLRHSLNVFVRAHYAPPYPYQQANEVFLFAYKGHKREINRLFFRLDILLILVHLLSFGLFFFISAYFNFDILYSLALSLALSSLIFSFALPFYLCLIESISKPFDYYAKQSVITLTLRAIKQQEIISNGPTPETEATKEELKALEETLKRQEENKDAEEK